MRIKNKSQLEMPISRVQLRQTEDSDTSNSTNFDTSGLPAPNDEVIDVAYLTDYTEPGPANNHSSDIFDPITQLGCVYDYEFSEAISNTSFCPNYESIAQDISESIDEQLNNVPVANSDNLGEARDHYRVLYESLNAPNMNIFDTQVGISFTSNSFNGEVSLANLTQNVCNLTSEYEHVHDQLNISDQARVDAFGCDYYTGDNENITEGPYCLIYISISGRYHMSGATVYLDSMVIDSRDSDTGVKRVFYSGYMRLRDYPQFTDEQLEGIDRNIPVTIRTYGSIIRERFDLDNPEFNMTIYPGLYQVDTGLVLSNLYSNFSLTLDPPRGVNNLNYLPASLAEITTLNGATTRANVHTTVSGFDFLAAGIDMANCTGEIDFVNYENYTVTFEGHTSLGNMTMDSTMSKINHETEYNVVVKGNSSQMINYEIFRDTLGGSFSTYNIELLPATEFYEELFDRVNLNSQNIHFYTPTLRLYFQPFLFYRMQGMHDTNGNGVQDCFCQGTLANIDGQILVNFNFVFEFSRSQTIFNRVFNVASNDTATQVFNITRFDLLASNRDFDIAKYDSLQETPFASQYNDLWKRGLNATVEVTLRDDCYEETFCTFLHTVVNMTGPVTLTGQISETTSVLEGPMNNFLMSNLSSFSNVYLQMLIDYDHETATSNVRMQIRGNLMLITENAEVMTVRSNLTYPLSDVHYINMTGNMLGIYENLFNLNNLLDLVEVSATGQINFDGTIDDLSINSLGILGTDCYTNSTLESSLMIQAMDVRQNGYFINESDYETIQLVNSDTCRIGNVKLSVNSYYMDNNYFKGLFEFSDVQSVLHVLLGTGGNSNLTDIVRSFYFPTGLVFDANLGDASLIRDLEFTGNMDWYGINSTGKMAVYLSNDTSFLSMLLPSFSIGSGNVQFVRSQDLAQYLNVTNEEQINDIISENLPDSFIEQGHNTLSINLTMEDLESAQVLLDTNVYLFGMHHHIHTYLTDNQFQFKIPGRPFGGAFNATSVVSVTPVEDIQNESNSIVQIFLDQDENFLELESYVNDILYSWIDNIVYTYDRMQTAKTVAYDERNVTKTGYVPENMCGTYEQ